MHTVFVGTEIVTQPFVGSPEDVQGSLIGYETDSVDLLADLRRKAAEER